MGFNTARTFNRLSASKPDEKPRNRLGSQTARTTRTTGAVNRVASVNKRGFKGDCDAGKQHISQKKPGVAKVSSGVARVSYEARYNKHDDKLSYEVNLNLTHNPNPNLNPQLSKILSLTLIWRRGRG